MTAIVVLPGLDGTGELLEPFQRALAQAGNSVEIISYPPDRPLGYAELETLVRTLLPQQPFVLMGESFSGPLAVGIAANPPPHLRGLILSTTFAVSPVPALRAFADLIRFAPARPPMPVLSWWLLGRWSTPELRDALGAALRAVAPEVLRTRAAAALRIDVRPLLQQVRVPVLCLQATHDRLVSPSVQARLAKGLRNSQIATITGPHLLLQTAVDESAARVSRFVAARG
ncbi:alpha/beta fold hydrolase [Aquimonas sp.]|jgi:pimeloyl-[acyl-carrier protein] methyl ester esterase|uniref:alpha/beta fold hydrolase n=1 Tax=Aquimonas sp. TaxID=1872588 RepID=UPI0037BFA187